MSRNVVIMGSDWLTNFATDSKILDLRKANSENVIVSAQMEAPELLNTHGLVLHSILRSPDMVAPVWICSFSPGSQYVAYEGATAAPWVAWADQGLRSTGPVARSGPGTGSPPASFGRCCSAPGRSG